ncbi:MAG TPA: TonB-dependent receptor [Chitinophagaceae bacterium]|jgi:outer membrane receptor protein involved in Fe transport|nr:TonB-dependent receptor [Chitinophagaceae bacterium]
MRKFLSVVTALLISALIFAQMPGGNRGGMAQQLNGGFYGKVLDSITGKPIEAASIQLIQNRLDTATKKRKEVIIGGMLTKANGQFSIEGVPVMGQYKLKITAIGFKNYEKNVSLIDMNSFRNNNAGNQDMASLLGNFDKDLGNIKLEIDQKVLGNVTVTGTKPLVQLGIDRKIYNVEKDLSAAGGTAADVMKNVPSVSVDIDGNVTLRNSSPQIYVDGRPTTLTLDQIPADQIASVEVITNPSAKFDASGGTAGILNIVLKKNRKAGYNGNIRAGVDMRGKVNGGGDINVRQGKVNFFANANYGQRKSISRGTTDRYTFLKNPFTNLHQEDKTVNQGYFAFGRVGLDFFMDNRNTFTVSGIAVHGHFKSNVNSDIFVDTLSGINKTSYTNRTSHSEGIFNNRGGVLSYLHNFPKNGHQLTADLNYNKSRNENSNDVANFIYPVYGNPQSRIYNQQQIGGGTNEQLTAQTDYTNPINDKTKFETGARMTQRKVASQTDVAQVLPDKTIILLPPLSSNYSYTDRVYAGYATYSSRIKENFGYQLGLRLESSDYSGTVHTSVKNGSGFKDTASKYSNSYAISFFPSVFLSEKLKHNQELQLNYSRRINRPNFFQLFPFTDYSDSLNLSRGNPNLKPEFTNSIEVSYQKTFPKNNSLLISAYYKHTDDLITRYQSSEINPLTDSTVFINTFINANSSFVGGMEFISKNKIAQWWDLTTNLNLYTSKINDDNVTTVDQVYSWFGKINNNFKLPKNFTLQLSGDYTSKTVLAPGGSASSGGGGMGGGRGGFGPSISGNAQGYSKPTYGVDAALRYEFLKNKVASLTLSVSDIFKTRKNDVYTQSDDFTQHALRTRDAQFFRLNFAVRFGKFDVALFKKKNIRGDQENMQNSMQGVQQ